MDSLPKEIGNSVSSTPQGPTKEFSAGFGILRAGWTGDALFEVEIAEDHNIDAIGIRYHSKEDYEDDIHVFIPPDYGGTESIDLLGQFKLEDSTPPSGTYHIYGYKGTDAGLVFMVEKVIGRVSFEIAPKLSAIEATVSNTGSLELRLSNNGNAPIRVSQLSNGDRSVEVDELISHDSEQVLLVNDPPFETEDGCDLIHPTERFDLQTIPALSTSVDVDTGRTETERMCTVTL